MLSTKKKRMSSPQKESNKASEAPSKSYLSRQHASAVNGIKVVCSALNDVVFNSTDDEIDAIIGC